jgi:isocitrate dehydrogenase kinase/phosphatase
VVLAHLYTERRLVPLNLYVQQASPEQARAAVIDFGQAIKDLAAANIFPGDTQLKNFGVTRHGRVAFYDYDEVALLTSCVFRRIPRSRCDDDELSDDTWFAVGERDIFPEEFRTWLGLSGELREAFEDAHGDLFDVEFWLTMQQRLQAGEIADVIPYPRLRRLKASPG